MARHTAPAATPEDASVKKTDIILESVASPYRHKARIMLTMLGQRLKFADEGLRVAYSDGTMGSNIIDLLSYWASPIQVKIPRPLDAAQFLELCQMASVPDSAFGYGRLSSKSISDEERIRKPPQRTEAKKPVFKWLH